MSSTPSTEESACLFATLGMLVLDELHLPGQKPKFNIIGGSGAYACLGARLYVPPPSSRLLGWLIRTGDDFPDTVKEYLLSWSILLLESRMAGQLSTRGELVYQDISFGSKSFRYTTEPLKIEPKHLLDTPLLSSRSFHLLTSPNDTIDQIRQLLNLRYSCGIKELPMIVWEPAPVSCRTQNLATCLEAVEFVDVFSPNHMELAALFDTDLSRYEQFDRATTEMQARKFLKHRTDSSKPCTIVVRAGQEGCCIYNRKKKDFVWLPSFYADSPKIVDPTGAGNAFLGGFAIGLLEIGDDLLAACYGTVASSFALEQISVPLREPSSTLATNGTKEDSELWNGTSVRGRLREYISRVDVVLDDT